MEGHNAAYTGLIDRFLSFSGTNDDFRAAVIVGSRARTEAPADQWSDLDIIVFTERADFYVSDTAWLGNIGDFSVTFTEKTPLGGCRERRVLFDRGLDTDLIMVPVEMSAALLSSPDVMSVFNRGARVLYDKDNMLAAVEKAGSASPPPARMMSQKSFDSLVNDFWYHAVWTAKKIARGEIMVALGCLNGYMNAIQLKMVETLTSLKADGRGHRWHGGRFFEQRTDKKIMESLSHCYAHYDEKDIRRSLINTMDLFRAAAPEISAIAGYAYPEKAEKTAIELVKEILLKKPYLSD